LMAAVNPISGVSYDPTLSSYNTDLALLDDSGLSSGSTDSSAYTLDGTLASLGQTGATTDTAQAAQTGINPAAYSLPFAFTNLNLLDQLTPIELSYLMGLPANQSSSSDTSAQPTSEATQTDLYAPSSAGVNPLGDPLTWQIGDDALYQMDSSLAAVLTGPASSDSSSAYSQDQNPTTVGNTVDTSA